MSEQLTGSNTKFEGIPENIGLTEQQRSSAAKNKNGKQNKNSS